MDKRFTILVVLFLLSGYCAAQNEKGKGLSEADTQKSMEPPDQRPPGKEDNTSGKGGKEVVNPKGPQANNTGMKATEKENKSTDKPTIEGNKTQSKKAVIATLRNNIHARVNQSNKEKDKQFRNENVVRERVMSLLQVHKAVDDPGIGEQVSEIARNLNKSMNKIQKARKKIDGRGWLTRTFFGGDEDAANTIDAQLNRNRQQIRKLEQISENTDPEVSEFIGEQVGALNQEQERLRQLVQEERKSGGLLGWLIK